MSVNQAESPWTQTALAVDHTILLESECNTAQFLIMYEMFLFNDCNYCLGCIPMNVAHVLLKKCLFAYYTVELVFRYATLAMQDPNADSSR
jgi:hypothetical protein